VSIAFAALRLPICCAALLLFVTAPAAAEWHFTPMIGSTFGGNTTLVDPELARKESRWNFGGVVRLIGPAPLGIEAVFVYTPGFFERGGSRPPVFATSPSLGVADSHTLALMANLVLSTPSRNKYGLRPFISGGVGLLQASRTDLAPGGEEALPPVRQDLTGYNIGGGAVGFLSDRTGVRLDLRYYGTLIPVEPEPGIVVGAERATLRFWTGSLGVVIRY
jgi:hypothetical protein